MGLTVDLWPGQEIGFLLVHGLASNARLWDGVAAWLNGVGHAVAALDQRGHGRSDKPDHGYDLATACDDLVAVLAALRAGPRGGDGAWRRPVVVGQSWGANVALEVAWRHPGLTAGVVCVDGGTNDLADRFPTWEACATVLAPPPLAGTPAADFETAVRTRHPDWPEPGIQATLANVEFRADGTVAPWLTSDRHMLILRSLYEHRPSTRFAGIREAVLLVPADTGDETWTAAKRAGVATALAALRRSRARWFAPADHDLHAQFPDQLAMVLSGATVEGLFG